MFLPRQHTASTSPAPATSSGAIGLTAADLIQQAENHWDVSAESILSAWAASLICIFLILLLYSTVRRKWRRIYLPRWKLRKPSPTQQEKAETKIARDALDKKGQKEYDLARFEDEPAFYPGFVKEETAEGSGVFEWVKKKDDGIWVGKAPKAPITFSGWMKPCWEDTSTELMAIIPRWFCCCWSFIGLRFCVTKKGEKKRQTILDLDMRLMNMLGLDAVIYLMFLRLLKYLFATISILATLLAFANYYINTETEYGSTKSGALKINNATSTSTSTNESTRSKEISKNIISNPNLLTAANVTSNGLLVHISFEVMVTMLVIIFVLKACTHHKRLVEEWEKMNCNEISFKTLFITNIDMSGTTNGEAKQRIKELVLDDDSSRIPCEVWFALHKMNPLEKRIEKFKKEAFKSAIKAVAIETFYEGQEKKKKHAYDSWLKRIFGKKKSARMKVKDALEEKCSIERHQEKIRHEQDKSDNIKLYHAITAAFVSLPTSKHAKRILANRKHKLSEAGYVLEKAPRTHNVLWKNLEKDAKSQHSHGVLGTIALITVCFLNTIPVMGIVFLTNVGIAIDRYPKLAKMQEEFNVWKVIFMVLEGVLPAAVAAIFAYFLPYIMRELNRWSGSMTRGQLDKDQIRQVFIFLLVSNFVVFSLIGVLYETISGIYTKIGQESIEDIYTSLGDLPAKITRAYISQSLYWFSWYPIRSIVMWLQLLQLPRLLMKTPQLIKFKTPQDLAEVTLAIHFEFALEYSFIIFAMVVGLIYAPLAPIVVIGATLHFWSAHIVHSQSLKYVNDAKETDGECWWVIINRLLFGTVLMQCLMVLTVTLKTRSPPLAVATALPIFLIVLFKLYLKKHYDSEGLKVSLSSEEYDQMSNKDVILERYVPDVLKEDWMPKGKTVKNRKLMLRATERIPALKELVGISGNPKSSRPRLRRKRRNSNLHEKYDITQTTDQTGSTVTTDCTQSIQHTRE